MSISNADKEDVLRKVLVEMERSFFILSNHYNSPELQRLLPLLGDIETQIKTRLADLRAVILSKD